MKFKNVKAWLLTTAFTAVIITPFLCTRWTGGDYSEAEKRTLASKPTIFLEDGSINPTAMTETINWLEDHIGFRDEFVRLTASIKYYFLGQSPSEKVHIGKNGWLYYIPDNNLEIATGEYPLNDYDLDKICHNMQLIRDKMKEENRDFVVVLPPSKISIYPENARYGKEDYRVTPVDIVAERLEQVGIYVVRIKDNLISEKENQQVYFKEDTHWNEAGAYVGYHTIIEYLNKWGLIDTPPKNVEYVSSEHLCDLTLMMGRNSAEKTVSSVIQHPLAEKMTDNSEKCEQYRTITNGSIIYTYTNPANKVNALFWGDSMFGSWNATELLAENFNNFTYVWNYNISEEMIKATDPDVVFLEMTERGIRGLATIQYDILQQKKLLTSVGYAYRANVTNNNGRFSIVTWGEEDPQVIFQTLQTAMDINKVRITFSTINKPQMMQLYYASGDMPFEEEKSICFNISPDQTEYELTGFDAGEICNLRLDLENGISDTCDIEKIELIYTE